MGSAMVQLGAFENKNLAKSEWQRFEKLLGSMLISKKMVIQKAESGGKIFYRLRASGFDDISDARQFCAAISDKNSMYSSRDALNDIQNHQKCGYFWM